MGGRLDAEIRVYDDFADANRTVASRIVELTEASARTRDRRFSLVLAGGGTPRGLYRMLADEFANRIDWSSVDLFWGDERYVPHDNPQSNFRMAREALIDHVPIPREHVFPMPTHDPHPTDAARAYGEILRSYFADDDPRFDLVLLGIGTDGHTASLFPGTPSVKEYQDWVVAVQAPADPPDRLTLTYPVLNFAANIFFLASGEQKAAAVRQATAVDPDPDNCPASGIDPEFGVLVWWLDASAARRL